MPSATGPADRRRTMGILSNIKSTYRKSEAAVVVQNLLEHQAKGGWFDMDPASLANRLVAAVWEQKPDVFGGKFGQRPHKITVAASALASGISFLEENDRNRYALVFSLGNILAEIEVNGMLYPLNSLDHQLLEIAASIFADVTSEDYEIPVENPNGGDYRTFEEWYAVFKRTAGETNPQLRVDDNSRSLLDFMEHEPLKRAFQDGIEPEALARDFAEEFDISTFGRR
jgi:hypothetical protein